MLLCAEFVVGIVNEFDVETCGMWKGGIENLGSKCAGKAELGNILGNDITGMFTPIPIGGRI